MNFVARGFECDGSCGGQSPLDLVAELKRGMQGCPYDQTNGSSSSSVTNQPCAARHGCGSRHRIYPVSTSAKALLVLLWFHFFGCLNSQGVPTSQPMSMQCTFLLWSGAFSNSMFHLLVGLRGSSFTDIFRLPVLIRSQD